LSKVIPFVDVASCVKGTSHDQINVSSHGNFGFFFVTIIINSAASLSAMK
jgi:hypothetical protein